MVVAKRQGKGKALENRTKEGPRTTINVRGVCNFLGSVSSQQKFEVTDGPVLQLCVTAQFYLESKGQYILRV